MKPDLTGDVLKYTERHMKRYRAIAEYYDADNSRHRLLEHDVPFFLGQLPRKKQSILELACGTARAAIPIAQAGHRVVGIDYAADMLAIANRKRDVVGLSDKELTLQKADILTLGLGRQFDWVCLFFNTFLSFTKLEDQDQALQSMRRHLRPRGRLWIDIFNPDLKILAREKSVGVDPAIFHVPELGRTVFTTTEIVRSKKPQVQEVTFRYSWIDENGVDQQESMQFEMTYLFPRELTILLERNGLRVEHLWGNYDGSAVTSRSPRIIARCCRI